MAEGEGEEDEEVEEVEADLFLAFLPLPSSVTGAVVSREAVVALPAGGACGGGEVAGEEAEEEEEEGEDRPVILVLDKYRHLLHAYDMECREGERGWREGGGEEIRREGAREIRREG